MRLMWKTYTKIHNAVRKWWLKRQLKRAYLAYMHHRDQYDCGNSLAFYISRNLTRKAERVNELMEALAEYESADFEMPYIEISY